MTTKRVLCLLFLLVFALGAVTPSAFADDGKDGCGPVPGGPSPQGGTCAPHEPVVIIVDVWRGVPVVIVVSPGEDRGPRKPAPTRAPR